MDLNPSFTSRKRRLPSNHAGDDGEADDDNDYRDISYDETPSKRLENSYGYPIIRRIHHLNTRSILRSLALTRLHVTSNFSYYNPHTSPILICVTRDDDSLYRTLCTLLPSLLPISPHLQTLCLMPAGQRGSTDLWAPYQRTIPIFTPADLEHDPEAADTVQVFLGNLPMTAASSDLVVLFNARGRSVWDSGDVDWEGRGCESVGSASTAAAALQMQLCRALGSLTQRDERDIEVMDLG